MRALAWLKTAWVQRALVSLALLGAVALWVNPGDIMREVTRFSPGWAGLALLISVAQVMLSAWRWRLTAARLEVPLRYRYALAEYYLALLVNQLLPGGVLGDAGRAHRHATQSASRASAWRAVVLERASGQAAVALLMVLALCTSPLWHRSLGVTSIVALVACLTLVGMGLVALGVGLSRRQALPAWCSAFGRDLRRSLLGRSVWYWQLSSSLAIVISYGLVMVCAARAIGVEQSALSILALAPVLLLAMLIPLSIAGWGLREGAAATIWMFVGLPSSQGVAISLAYGVLVMLSSVPGIWVALSRRGRATPSNGGGVQTNIEQRIVTAAEGAHPGAQRALQRIDRRHFEPRPAGADQKRGHHQVQRVDGAGLNEFRNRDAAAFYQNTLVAALVKQRNDISGGELAGVIEGQHALRSATFQRLDAGAGHVQRGRLATLQHAERSGRAPARVEHHAHRVAPLDVTHGELRVIRHRGARADHHGVRQRSEPVQVHQALEAVDVVGVAAFGGDTPVKALTQLRQRPALAHRQRRQAFQHRARLDGQARGVIALPVTFAVDAKRAVQNAGAPVEQPAPGGFTLDRPVLAAGTGTVRTYNTVGVGHDASMKRTTWNHARGTRPAQAATLARSTRQPGGLHVSH